MFPQNFTIAYVVIKRENKFRNIKFRYFLIVLGDLSSEKPNETQQKQREYSVQFVPAFSLLNETENLARQKRHRISERCE